MGERPGGSGAAISPVQQMLASGTGALLTSIFVTPLDVVKIRLQAQQTPFHQALARESAPWGGVIRPSKWKCFLYCNGLMDHIYVCQNRTSCTSWYKTPTHFSGTLDAFVKITRHEGLRSLWSGLPPTLVMAVPATVIYFTCYDQLRDFLRSGLGLQGSFVPLVAGGLARPFYWFNYELVKAQLCEESQMTQANFSISFTAGAVSGAVAAILTLPFDVVKTRRQIQLGEMDAVGASLKGTKSTWHIMKDIWAEMGYRGLFAGFMPRVIKVAPACAVMISTYEFGKAFFQEVNLDRERLGT
ncbi:mitochondrial glutathione transporter SLC25A39 isoform X3 [Gasterosteus aculeatus]